ncbi:hypothetical protein NPIL_340281 [Nephila pilipes]|uniref:Uncharacterized protein n=1 Tax=Nephila pilipes TaxID=299642 RepID=A0A8X6THR7_NEPPI|nr:hypothetical protein NPIL_340281 [Nephila pilipes]
MWNSSAAFVSGGGNQGTSTGMHSGIGRGLNPRRRGSYNQPSNAGRGSLIPVSVPYNYVYYQGPNAPASQANFDYGAAINRWRKLSVECKLCGQIVSVLKIAAHMEDKHYWKVLRPVNDNKLAGQEVEEAAERPSHGIYDRSFDLHEKIMPGITTRKNSGNYALKICREKMDDDTQAAKQKLVAELKKRIL